MKDSDVKFDKSSPLLFCGSGGHINILMGLWYYYMRRCSIFLFFRADGGGWRVGMNSAAHT